MATNRGKYPASWVAMFEDRQSRAMRALGELLLGSAITQGGQACGAAARMNLAMSDENRREHEFDHDPSGNEVKRRGGSLRVRAAPAGP